MKLKNITVVYGKTFSVKVGEITIPRYVLVGALLVAGTVITLKQLGMTF